MPRRATLETSLLASASTDEPESWEWGLGSQGVGMAWMATIFIGKHRSLNGCRPTELGHSPTDKCQD